MKASQSEFVDVRGLRYHCRTWGSPGAPQLFLLHGFQDVSASWQFTADALQRDWFVIAPDWRGYGLSEWTSAGSYWFPDYFADLDCLLEHFSPGFPVRLVAHSMGGNICSMYAGIAPERIGKFVNIEGIGMGARRQDPAPRRFAKWLVEIREGGEQRPYESFQDFADRMQAENPRLTDARALFLAENWGKQEPDGTVVRRADPKHTLINPLPIPTDDMLACWRQITAPVLWVEGGKSGLHARIARDPEGYEARCAAIQDLQVTRIDDAGHNVHHDQPEQLAQVIEQFMAQ
ncbi:MAG: alpha/beta hydrolase [Betaproteobacteria bacterium]|nr:MAG: alpha/beta hydrolase [Betaproteobacteria bacterium]